MRIFRFHNRSVWFVAAVGALAVALTSVVPRFPAEADDKIKEQVTLSGNHQEQQFVAGRRIDVDANVADDIFAAGRDLSFDGAQAKTIIAAGMNLTFKGITAGDMIIAGGQIDLGGNITDDVVAAVCPFCPFHGRLHIKDGTQIGDDARLAGREITVDGRIGGDLYSGSSEFRLSGEVVGNAKIEAKRIVLAPSARVGGDLLYASPNKPEIQDGAVVTGEVRMVEMEMPFFEGPPKNWIWYIILAIFGFLLALILLAVALQLIVPRVMDNAVATMTSKPWSTLGRGLVLALLVPAAVALLMATVIGIPIGLLSIASFFVLGALAFVAVTYCIGLFLRGLFGNKDAPVSIGSRLLWTVVGILILLVVGLVPFVGPVVGVLAIVAGLGAVISQLSPVFGQADVA